MRNGYSTVSGLVFAVVAILQVLRAVKGWPVHIDTFEVPVTASWIAAVVAGLLSIWGFSSRAK